MPADLKVILTRLLAELEREEETEANEQARAELEALKGRKVTIADIREAISEADPDTRAELRDLLAAEIETPPADEPEDDGDELKRKREPKPKTPKPQTRPGRRAGHAYDFDVDEDGRIVPLEVVRIYSGADEPETVELPSDDEEKTA